MKSHPLVRHKVDDEERTDAATNATYDAVVIGGGPAGLQATLTLARVHRTVLMVDSGSYRNDPAAHMHNVVTHDGTPPAEFRAAARKELAAYDTVAVRDTPVTSVARDGDGLRRLPRRRAGPRPRRPARDRRASTRCRTGPGWPSCSARWSRTARSATATSSRGGRSASSARRAPVTCRGWSGRSRRGSRSSPTARSSPTSCREGWRSAPTR